MSPSDANLPNCLQQGHDLSGQYKTGHMSSDARKPAFGVTDHGRFDTNLRVQSHKMVISLKFRI